MGFIEYIAESEPVPEVDLKQPIQKIILDFLRYTRALYPGIASRLIVKSDGKDMYTTMKGEDKTFTVLDLKTGKIEDLG
jgi:hypothetical protein